MGLHRWKYRHDYEAITRQIGVTADGSPVEFTQLAWKGSTPVNDELMNGTNPKADAELAAALGCKLSPEQDEIVPQNYAIQNRKGEYWRSDGAWMKDINDATHYISPPEVSRDGFKIVSFDARPLVAIGPAGYETDASGKPVDILQSTLAGLADERRKIAFERGLIYARSTLTSEMMKMKNDLAVQHSLSQACQLIKEVDVNAAWKEINK